MKRCETRFIGGINIINVGGQSSQTYASIVSDSLPSRKIEMQAFPFDLCLPRKYKKVILP